MLNPKATLRNAICSGFSQYRLSISMDPENLIMEPEFKRLKNLFSLGFGVFEKRMRTTFSQKLKEKVGNVNLILANNKIIRDINFAYRKIDDATDVIAFAYLEGIPLPDPMDVLEIGDIFISLETAQQQAEEKGHKLERELEILLIHGLLHLIGFDHNNDDEERKMESLAGKILKEIWEQKNLLTD